jgi:hypothetical protein
MHNIDRTQMEMDPREMFEQEYQEGDFSREYAQQEAPLFESNFQEAATYEEGLGEVDELAFASELLEITNENELDQFLGRLFKKVSSGIGRFMKSPVGGALGNILKTVAKTALPIAGKAAGAYFGGPIGSAIGGQVGSTAGSMFGLEGEGMSDEDREFEIARRYVKFASDAARRATFLPTTLNPMTAAKTAVAGAARRYAPGLLRRPSYYYSEPDPGYGYSTSASGRTGRWVRRGNRIIIYGA